MKKKWIMAIVIGFMLTPISTVMAGGDQNRGEKGIGQTYENGCIDQPCFETAPKPGSLDVLIQSTPKLTTVLDEAETLDLKFIREEEKLARDVYRSLYNKWGNPVFAVIAKSEQAHMDAMAKLLNFYGIEDPVKSDEIGVFTDKFIGDLFEWLIEWGSRSKPDALLVGGYIEEYDILDTWEAHDETDEEWIRQVYQNLYEGSYNHLNAFVYNYELLTGKDYGLRLLKQEQYEYVMDFDTQARKGQDHKQQMPKQKKGK